MIQPAEGEGRVKDFWVLPLTALGVVFGDIGTSPIYAIRESFHLSHGLAPDHDNTLGILSLIFWSLILVISIKYLLLVLRAGNRGEGGIIALTALIAPPGDRSRGRKRILHERVLLMTVETEEIPYVPEEARILVEDLGEGFYSVVALYGFAEDPDVPKVLRQISIDDYRYNRLETTFFLGQRTFIIPSKPNMARWRSRLFDRMARNAERASEYFRIPVDRVVELGAHVEL